MIARGGIKHCADAMLAAFHIQHYPMLVLLHNPVGSYYTAVTESELTRLSPPDSGGRHRLVFRGTEKELLALCSTKQLNFLDGGNGNGLN